MDVVGPTFTQVSREFGTGPNDWGANKHIRGDVGGTRLYNHSSFSISGFGEKAALDRQAKWDAGASQIKDSIDREFGPGMGERIFAKVGQETGRNLDHGVTRGDVGRMTEALRGSAPLKPQLDANQRAQAEIFTLPPGGTPGTVTRTEATDRALQAMFGKRLSDAEIRGLCGLPDSASVTLELTEPDPREHFSPDSRQKAVTMRMSGGDVHGAFKEARMTVYKTESGKVNLFRDKSKLNPELRNESRPPSFMGGAMLAKQVNTARSLGIETIHNFSAHGKGYNGYYTWPRYGGDAPLTDRLRDRLEDPSDYEQFRERLAEASDEGVRALAGKPDLTLQELMSTQPGRDFWRQHGFGIPVTFDLRPDSPTMRAFESYTLPNSCFDLNN